MIERGSRLGFSQQSLLRRLVAAQVPGKKLERHGALQPQIVSTVDNSHAARAQLLLQLVMADLRPEGGPRLRGGALHRVRQAVQWAGGAVGPQQALNLAAQGGISAAIRRQERGALLRRPLQRGGENFADPRPIGGGGGAPRGRILLSLEDTGEAGKQVRGSAHRFSSRFSHARAMVQSRFTVAGDD